ncbi:alanine dehydrogenase [Photobacterium minamisatsumaniensis]|uniref:alanine dehydrogenase n=1 Tax=Photobacterium minamisatsumaniensis TaxID=2910233 RepID=UPI003D0CEEDA
MIIGIPKEIKVHEYRVGMTPASVREVCTQGHTVYLETGAGLGIGCNDDEYRQAGAKILATADEVFAIAEMIVKVKEPLAVERARLRANQLLFTYLHLAPDMAQTEDLIQSEAVCIAYETVTGPNNSLPLLAPMSEVAGRMSIQAGAACLEKSQGGVGLLLGGVAGVAPAKVTIIGGGVVGANAAQMAVGLGADTTILDNNIDTLRRLNAQFGSSVKTVYSNQQNLEDAVIGADLVVGGVLIPGAAAPKLVSEKMVQAMRPGSALVDVAIDQGGCFETSVVTTHDAPTYIKHGIVHYCVGNMPGALARTSAFALNNATLPYILRLANLGYKDALLSDQNLMNGLNVIHGKVTNESVARSLDLSFINQSTALSAA